MFSSKHLITASKLQRNFSEIANRLEEQPQALLIVQKSKNPLVLVNADIYEDLVKRVYGMLSANSDHEWT